MSVLETKSSSAAPKLMSPTLLCWPTMSKADGSMAREFGFPTNILLPIAV